MADLEALLRRYTQAKDRRANFESTWQEIADRVLPQMADFQVKHREPGGKRTELMFDGTPALALLKFASAIESFTIPRSSKWHGLQTTDDDLNKLLPIKRYFEDVTSLLFRVRYSPRANFASQANEVLLSYGAFGTGGLFLDDDVRRATLRYKSVPLARTYVLENDHGAIDTVFRTIPRSARQIAQFLAGLPIPRPERLPAKVKEALEKAPDVEQWEVIHFVGPSEDYVPGGLGHTGMRWKSCYFMVDPAKTLLDEGGFTSWPFAFGRFMTTAGEVYARSPAWLALANIKVLNEQKKTSLKVGHKIADPPLLVADEGVLAPFSQVPGYMNYGALAADGEPLVKPLITGAKLELTLEMMDKEREIIGAGFMLDVFTALVENPQMTATQALELLNERANIAAPVIGRLQGEFLGATIERELQLLADAQQLPEMPPELQEAQGDYKVEFTGPMNRAMRASDAIAIVRTFEAILPLAESSPDVLDAYDIPLAARELGEINGFPAKCMRSPDDIKKLKAAREQQAEVGAMVEAAPAVSAAAANLVKMQQAGGMPRA